MKDLQLEDFDDPGGSFVIRRRSRYLWKKKEKSKQVAYTNDGGVDEDNIIATICAGVHLCCTWIHYYV